MISQIVVGVMDSHGIVLDIEWAYDFCSPTWFMNVNNILQLMDGHSILDRAYCQLKGRKSILVGKWDITVFCWRGGWHQFVYANGEKGYLVSNGQEQ